MAWYDNLDPNTPQGMQLAGLLGGLNALGAGLLQAGAPRPVGQAGPGLGEALGAFGQGQRAGLQGAYQNAQVQRQMSRQAVLAEAQSAKPDDQISPQARAYRSALSTLPESVRTLADSDQLPQLAVQQATSRVRPMTAQELAAAGYRPGTVAYVNDFTGAPNVAQQPDIMSPEALQQRIAIQRAGLQAPAPLVLGPGQSAYDRSGRLIASGPTMREQPVAVGPGTSLVNPATGQLVYTAPSSPITASPGQVLLDPVTGQPRGGVPQNPVVMSPNQSLVNPATGQPVATMPGAQEPFTLGPGQTRFGPNGQPVAAVPERPQTVTLSPGQVVVNATTGQQIARAADKPERVTLSPGQSVIDLATGRTVATGGPDPKEARSTENQLRDEYTKLSGDFRTVQDAYKKISMTSNTGQGDLALLYSYMKILDPGSVVRESEFALAAKSGSFGEQMQGLVTRVLNGERLPDTVRNGFRAEAEKVYKAQAQSFLQYQDMYRGLAIRNNANPDNVVLPFQLPQNSSGGGGGGSPPDPLGILGPRR